MARIGIHATALETGRTGGAETYLRQLLTAPAFRRALAGHEVLVFAGEPTDPAVRASGFEVVRCPIDPRRRNTRIVWDQVALPALLRRHCLDLAHFPYSSICRGYDGPQVVTVHDTTNFIMPRSVRLVERLYRKCLQTKITQNERCAVIAVSDTDRAILTKNLRLPPNRSFTVHHGRPVDFAPMEMELGRNRRNGSLVWIGRPYYHKNIRLLLDMMRELRRIRGGPTPVLRMIGIDGPERGRLKQEAIKADVADLVRFEAPVPHAQIPRILAEASLFVFPSRYESFGLPPLEAQCAGTPVVCSDLPILREILGDGALFAPPDAPAAFAGHVHALLSDPDRWAALARRGQALSTRYSWDRCARETAAVYEATLARFMRR